LKRLLNKTKSNEAKLKQKLIDLEKEMATLRKENLKINSRNEKKYCSRCGIKVELTSNGKDTRVKRAGTGYRSPMKYRSKSRNGSKKNSRLGSRKNSVTGSRTGSRKGSAKGSRTSTPVKRKKRTKDFISRNRN
jgi:hypothetical protein